MSQIWAQENYYVFIHAQNDKPFLVKFATKVFESSNNGDLLISNLIGNTCEFAIEFYENPNTQWKFNCNTSAIDQVYMLKNISNKTVELTAIGGEEKKISGLKVDIASAKQAAKEEKKITGIMSDDPFSSMLAEVVNDPTIKQQPVIIAKPSNIKTANKDSANTLIAFADTKNNQKKEDITNPTLDSSIAINITNNDTTTTLENFAAKQEDPQKENKIFTTINSSAIATTTVFAKQDSIITNAQPLVVSAAQPETLIYPEKKLISKSSNIKKTLQRRSNEGIELIYIDELTDGTKDIIRILIPANP
jgi:hypothetical protein